MENTEKMNDTQAPEATLEKTEAKAEAEKKEKKTDAKKFSGNFLGRKTMFISKALFSLTMAFLPLSANSVMQISI